MWGVGDEEQRLVPTDGLSLPALAFDSVVPMIGFSFCYFPSLCLDPTPIWAQGNFITYQIKSVITSSLNHLHREIFPAVSDRAFLLYGIMMD